jgi:trimeric autotransporter adhesin
VKGIDEDGNETTRDKTITYTRKHAGLIAQEVKAALDRLGIDTTDFAGFVDANVNGGPDRLMLRYLEFIPPLIKAVQELSARIETLEG